jgi:hypothetical protein
MAGPAGSGRRKCSLLWNGTGRLEGAGIQWGGRLHGNAPHLLSMNGIHGSGVALRSRKSMNSL